MSLAKIRISARQSELAQIQARQVGAALLKTDPSLSLEYQFRESLGDKNLSDPLWKMPEKGVFTQDFKLDLLNQSTDLVVHSWKDLPTEGFDETFIAATLPRADQRDLIFFKKKSLGQTQLQFYSSSPRRAHNLKSFLSWALPFETHEISFHSVRGNMQTRMRKWLEHPEIDGLILAKAAVDRLLENGHVETQKLIREILQQELWMVSPLSENPNAAAQGALAVEIKRGRPDLEELLKKINCRNSFYAAQKERDILKSFGGGCHLALGMSCLVRDYGEIEIVAGRTPENEIVKIKKVILKKSAPEPTSRQKLKFEQLRRALPALDVRDYDALYVAKAEAWNILPEYRGVVWTSGLETWKKLSRIGVWVNGSQESLGEQEDMRINLFCERPLNWARLTHDAASDDQSKTQLAAYQVELVCPDQTFDLNKAFVWSSGLEFKTAVQKFPQIAHSKHICGPGRTFQLIKTYLGSDQNIWIDLNFTNEGFHS